MYSYRATKRIYITIGDMMKIIIFMLVFLLPVNVLAVKEWAEVFQGKVTGIHDMPDDKILEFNPNSFRYAIEITNLNPKPERGWLYNIVTGEFSDPGPMDINPITSKAFYLRLTGAEREAFITSADAKVRQFSYWLSLSGDVDLMDAKVIAATNYLETIGVIGVGRAAVILTIEHQ